MIIVKSFRGKKLPKIIKSKEQLIEYVLIKERYNEPISNSEFVFDLRCTRFGGTLHNLREKGYDIVTLPMAERGHFKYYLVSMPGDTRKDKAMSRKLHKQRQKA